ncbi:sensor histidine kinase [Nocardioides sp.]|uniref:sensor histidine kinase n=1 Tax=Nocardioides sp. TaxID=35761 RepID=UPI0025ED6F24|nr:sensor histidine kinase [Nocardioides sp.]
MSSTRAATLAALVAAVAVAAAATAIALVAADDAWHRELAHDVPVDAAVGVSYAAAAALVLAGTGGRRIGWLLLGIGLSGAGAALTSAIAATATEPSTLASGALFVQSWIWVPGFVPLLTVVPLVYPDGWLPSRSWRPVLIASVLGMMLLAAGSALYPEGTQGAADLQKPWTHERAAQLLDVAAAVLLVPVVVAVLVALVVRWRRAAGLVRRQVAVLVGAAAVLVIDTALQPVLGDALGVATQVLAVALVPAAIGVAVTRHRLYDLDLALCRAVSGASLAVCLACIYLTLFTVTSAIVPGGATSGAAAAAAVCGLLLHPLGARLSRGVDRLFYGERARPERLLEVVASGLREGVDLGEVPRRLCRAVVESLRLGSAEIVLGDDVEGRPTASVGTASGPATDLPMEHRGEIVGRLRVTARAGERAVTERDAEILRMVCDQVAPAVAALLLSERLHHSRAALVTAREEERRRLRRDLHDGVGAALAGVRLQVETARDLVADPVTGGLLESAAAGVATAVDDLRGITEDLRPPALDDLGLGAGLRGIADRMSAPGTQVDVVIDPALDAAGLPAAIEVACYRIAAEAVANAVRHADAQRISVRLCAGDGALSLLVEDDGRGLPERVRPGALGLTSMRQRADEIGGLLDVVSDRRGTRVRAELPLEAR